MTAVDEKIKNIELKRLSKRYAGARYYSLDNVSLSVKAGEVYGLLGANGAGKSTTIRTLLNFLQPTSGYARICGHDTVKNSVETKKYIGYLAGDLALYEKMTGHELLSYMTSLQPLKDKSSPSRLIKQFEAQPAKRIGQLSKGNRQKIGIIQAFMHEPDVLILDEPTSGLDPLMQEEFFSLIDSVRHRGASVLVSSHNFAEVQRMCDRIGFLKNGRLVAERTISELADQASHTFTITFADKTPLAQLHQLKHAHIKTINERSLTISIEGELTPLLELIAKYRVIRLDQQEINIEEEFMKFYKDGDNAS